MDITLRQEASGDWNNQSPSPGKPFESIRPWLYGALSAAYHADVSGFYTGAGHRGSSQNMVVGHAICLRAVIHADSGGNIRS